MEEKLYQYLNRIRQIDSILEEPIRGVIDMAWDRKAGLLRNPLVFERWIAEKGRPQSGSFRTTSCLCMATLQRIWQVHRRFPWMTGDERLDELRACIRQRLDPVGAGPVRDAGERFEKLVESLSSQTFGPLNALTAGQVFRVLLQQGEGETHGELGFLAFFAMIWSLERRYPDQLARGASLGPWGPTAYVTAKCLLPIASVSRVCRLRAELLRKVAKLTKQVREASAELDGYGQWRFTESCDQLSETLFSLSALSISPEAVSASAAEVANIGGEISALDSWTQERANDEWGKVLSVLESMLQELGHRSKEIVTEVEEVFQQINLQILDPLEKAQQGWISKNDLNSSEPVVWAKLAERVREEWRHWGKDPDYLEDLLASGRSALRICKDALIELREVSEAASSEDFNAKPANPKERSEKIETIFQVLADRYLATEKVIDKAVGDDARWCRSVMERQIAHVSAGNYTEFDAAELVSAIAVAVRWRQINTPLQVRDAVSKALAGAREDGSWSPGRPFYPRDDAVGAWSLTSDLVATLASAIRRHPDVDVADEALMRYVDWLERTRLQITRDGARMTGWASDRSPSHERIDLWATSFAIEALLEIRDLLEYRLWQLCERRFTVIRKVTPLDGIDPVDLGAQHKKRLHRRLYRMARETQGKDFARGQYSLVLHGPPGSSKTKVAEAISDKMWTSSLRWGRREPRLVRITPADFTRGGEDRIDFEARLIFDLLRHLRGVTIFFDEIDDLLRKRDPVRHPSFIDLVIPGMLNRLQDLRDACPRQEICFLIATNYIEKIEPALIRKGRIDDAIPVTYPDSESRRMMVYRHSRALAKAIGDGENESKILKDYGEAGILFAQDAGGWPWTALDSLLKNVRREVVEKRKRNPSFKVKELFDREQEELRNTFSEPGYRQRFRDILVHPNLRIEFATHFRATRFLQGNGSAVDLEEAALESLGSPDWKDAQGKRVFKSRSPEVEDFRIWFRRWMADSPASGPPPA